MIVNYLVPYYVISILYCKCLLLSPATSLTKGQLRAAMSNVVQVEFTVGLLCPGAAGQGLSQDLETGCSKLTIVKFLGIQIFKGNNNILRFQPYTCINLSK